MATPETSRRLTVTDALNAYAEQCMKNRDFRIECCRSWQAFRDDSIGEDIAAYTRKVNREIDWKIEDQQIEAIRRFPPEALRLLRSFITQFLSCPKEGRTTLHTRYAFETDSTPSITITIDGDNDALVTLRAAQVV